MSTDQGLGQGAELALFDPPAPLAASPGRVLLPEEYDPELTARLDALDVVSDSYAETLRPKNTRRGYASDWKTWETFAALRGVPLTSAVRLGVLRAYVDWMWREGAEDGGPLASTTIDRKLAGLAVTLRKVHKVVINPDHTKAARELLKDLERRAAEDEEAPRGRGKAPAVTVPMLRAMVEACPDDLTGLRDRAALLLAFGIAGRRHEVAGLTVRSMELHGAVGMYVNVRVSKTDPRRVRIRYADDERLCPVRTWLEWKEAALLEDPDTPAVRRMHRTGSVTRAGLSAQSVGNIITDAGERANLPVRLTGHSMRAGLITEARRHGKDRKVIGSTSGHVDGSPVLDGYIRDVDGWEPENNALAGLL
ncbi:tyrosine-type recombinase/integrase [Streptomyces sp. NPDC059979]|uniref:tyrosine-type recombinase/integrase n=1 Tax=Streptomyces sp. NPDC059979 TaxID=3347021 RepID=UPI0036C27ED1